MLEALTKYAIAYDLGGVDIRAGRRIVVEEYSRNADWAPWTFDFLVE